MEEAAVVLFPVFIEDRRRWFKLTGPFWYLSFTYFLLLALQLEGDPQEV